MKLRSLIRDYSVRCSMIIVVSISWNESRTIDTSDHLEFEEQYRSFIARV